MIAAICRFDISPSLSRDEIVTRLEQGIPFYQNREALIRKYNCIDLDNSSACGIYLWTDKRIAEAYFDEVKPIIREQMGCAEPDVSYLDAAIIVDNSTGECLINR